MRLPRLPFPASPPRVFSVSVDSVQVCWGALPAGTVTLRGAGRHASITHGGGPGSLRLSELPPGQRVSIELSWDSGATTFDVPLLHPPGGSPLTRIATISDLHLGSDHFGVMKMMREPDNGSMPFALRNAMAAIEEIIEWGAERLVIKGDAAHHGHDDHFVLIGRLVDAFPEFPIVLLPGNHDVDRKGGAALPATVGERALPFVLDVDVVDLAGVRLIGANTTIEQAGTGTILGVQDHILDAAAASDLPALVMVHQQFQVHQPNRYWPPGIPAAESRSFLDRLDDVPGPALVSSGHTHRNRFRRHGSVGVAEVACTHHWPGVWAGYTVFEGGWTQEVRRIGRPDVLPWMEYTKNAVGGIWGKYAPGTLDDRCFSESFGPVGTSAP